MKKCAGKSKRAVCRDVFLSRYPGAWICAGQDVSPFIWFFGSADFDKIAAVLFRPSEKNFQTA
ncbi:hypothetical protein BV914_04085 [Neisseria dumasiana]|uniref:Uncharacterized protein n=1 Tax=Neisseria dumasiana TaxID=1931275 RepID=A0ABX3WK96_9NEIS|nr:hypothetical protein BV914_04085 [Neisseria dumasiana]OSI30613.1 hypothetical protein BV913_10950 [Neisseria dumasiana]